MDPGRDGKRTVHALADFHAMGSDPSLISWVCQQVFRQRTVEIEYGVAIETHYVAIVHQQFNGAFVIEDHLGLDGCFPMRCLALLNQPAGIEPGVGVALQVAGCPG